MAKIGEQEKTVRIEPIEKPVTVPVPAPEREPVPA